MTTNRLATTAASAVLALAGLTACSTDTATAPARVQINQPSFDLSFPGSDDTYGEIRLCKVGSGGTFRVTFTGNFTAGNVTGGLVATADPADGNTYTVTLAAPGCIEIWNRQEQAVGFDTNVRATITETSSQAGFAFQNVEVVTEFNPSSVDLATKTGAVESNMFHDAIVTFTNVVAAGCTHTIGWYMNKGASSVPTGTFSNSGQTYAVVLATEPKGNAYYILARQYIAATLNAAAGASVPADVQAALNAAAAYLAVATPGTPLPGTYTKDQVTAIATVLDNYNNGLLGPIHCP